MMVVDLEEGSSEVKSLVAAWFHSLQFVYYSLMNLLPAASFAVAAGVAAGVADYSSSSVAVVVASYYFEHDHSESEAVGVTSYFRIHWAIQACLPG